MDEQDQEFLGYLKRQKDKTNRLIRKLQQKLIDLQNTENHYRAAKKLYQP